MTPKVGPYSRATVLVQAFVDGKTKLRCRETGSMDGLLLQCDLEHFDHVIMDLRPNLEHKLSTVVNGLGLPESRHEISASRFRQRLDHKKYQISQLSQWTTDELSRERQQGASSADDKNKRQEAVQACSLSLRVLWRRERGQ